MELIDINKKPAPAERDDFIAKYLQYTHETEVPKFFSRWVGLSVLAAYIGRQVYLPFGNTDIYPNLYLMFIGSPGSKKSTAIKTGVKLAKGAGYTKFAAQKTRQEKFLMDLAGESDADPEEDEDILDKNLWGPVADSDTVGSGEPSECYITADEFNVFIGAGNLDFVSILGDLWDYDGVYDYRLKNSKSIKITDPCVNILSGNTPTNFSHAFPPEVIGQGFFSRLLLIYGEPSGVKYTFPPQPDPMLQVALIAHLEKMKKECTGVVVISPTAIALVDRIYHSWEDLADQRFAHYSNRRLQHMLKLCMLAALSRCSNIVLSEDVVYANTILSFTETLMPKALGEFGKARHSAVSHKVMLAITETRLPMRMTDLWKVVCTDLDNRQQLVEILTNLQVAEKIQIIQGEGGGYLPIKKIRQDAPEGTVDWSILSEEELALSPIEGYI